jgi:hypothetical protein
MTVHELLTDIRAEPEAPGTDQTPLTAGAVAEVVGARRN